MKAESIPAPITLARLGGYVVGSFVILAPLVTFVLLVIKGLPTFALSHLWGVLVWVYQVTWLAALWAGLGVWLIVAAIVKRTGYFHLPYDFGRSFSLGAICGALAEAGATGFSRAVAHKPVSGFWIAGAMMSGCVAGACINAIALWRLSRIQLSKSAGRQNR